MNLSHGRNTETAEFRQMLAMVSYPPKMGTSLFLCPSISEVKFSYIAISLHDRDSNLGPNCLCLLEFETWQIRPLGHHGQFATPIVIV